MTAFSPEVMQLCMGCRHLSAAWGHVGGLAGTYSFSMQETQLMDSMEHGAKNCQRKTRVSTFSWKKKMSENQSIYVSGKGKNR